MRILTLTFYLFFLLAVFATGFAATTPPTNQPHVALSDAEISQTNAITTPVYFINLPIVMNRPYFKKGMGVARSPACPDAEKLNIGWYSNWHAWPDTSCTSDDDVEFIPRIYNDTRMIYLSIAIDNAIKSGWLLGFNEPNLAWQGNMTPAEGAINWREIELAADEANVKLASPAPNQWDPGQNGQTYGHQWTWAMVDEYRARYGTNPRFDALAWNIYSPDPNDIKAFLQARRNEALARGYDVPFWIIEYGGACTDSVAVNISAMQQITPWFEETEWIDRYAWFANRLTGAVNGSGDVSSCSLIDVQTGEPSQLGNIYKDY